MKTAYIVHMVVVDVVVALMVVVFLFRGVVCVIRCSWSCGAQPFSAITAHALDASRSICLCQYFFCCNERRMLIEFSQERILCPVRLKCFERVVSALVGCYVVHDGCSFNSTSAMVARWSALDSFL